ncbi:MAG: YaiI/YqxD family protein [Deltaproteobacteria bacterium]|nr:YaiI/YqxD family protein [Deltaproteobacteria bacterium]
MLNIFIDADACPVKQEVFRVAERFKLGVTLVSNMHMRIPENPRVKLVIVESGPDEADNWIVENATEGDIVITADIPLADRSLKKGACVISPSGRLFTEDNIGQILATRNLMADLRDLGEITGGPAPFTRKERSNFLQQLDTLIHSILRRLPAR